MINPQLYPHKLRDVSSAWKGLERYILPIIKHFNADTKTALEFGVDLGYSSEAFSNIFDKVVGVDSFIGDQHINHAQGEAFYKSVCKSFVNSNVDIVKSSFEDFIKDNGSRYDLIHIDIVHEYIPTYACAEWAVQHSDIVILHDTVSFPEINRVCNDIAANHNIGYMNIQEHFGLGILYKLT